MSEKKVNDVAQVVSGGRHRFGVVGSGQSGQPHAEAGGLRLSDLQSALELARPLAGVTAGVRVDCMDSAQQIKPGDFILTTIHGFGADLAVRIGQALSGKWSEFSHAALYVGGPDRLCLEMAPGGIAVRPLTDFAGRPLAISDWPLDLDERDTIVEWAWAEYRHKPPRQYGWLNYPLIGAARLGIRPGWGTAYLSGLNYQICSQWVDNAYLAADVHLFTDGRLPGLVSPGDLTYVLSRPKTA